MHVAIIPDGNRRWAKGHGLEATKGHAAAVRDERVREFFKKAIALNVNYVSIWVFSTDNWKRSKKEQEALFSLLLQEIAVLKRSADELGIRVKHLGRTDRIPKNITEAFADVEAATKDNNQLFVQLCFDYGGRDEILRAVNQAVANGEEVTEKTFSQLLDTDGIPDVDLIIRTSGEQRLSGFLPWQSVHAELFFSDKHFPDFSPEDLEVAISDFQNRQRRFGGD